jgi:MFS family permease
MALMRTKGTQRIKPPFFYGWIIVGAGAISGAFNLGSAGFATSTFLGAMQSDLGWSQTIIFGALSVRVLLGGLLGPIIGPLADHPWAPRVILPLGSIFLALSFILLRWVETPFQYYMVYGVLGSLGVAAQGSGMWQTLAIKWFVRKRAKALSWSNAGAASGPLIFPLFLTFLIGSMGWRDAWLWLGITTLIIVLPFSLLARTNPEVMNMLPDGDTPESQPSAVTPSQRPRPVEEYSFTKGEALRSRSFWILTLAMSLAVVGITGYQAHWIPYLQEQGFSLEVAASGVAVYGFFNVGGRFVWGYLAGKYNIRTMMVLQGCLATLGVIFMLFIFNPYMMVAWGVFQGLNLAGFFMLQSLATAEFFGRGHIGAIRGFMTPFANGTRAVAPLLLGFMHDWSGSYTIPFLIVVGTWIMASLAALAIKPPRMPTPKP